MRVGHPLGNLPFSPSLMIRGSQRSVVCAVLAQDFSSLAEQRTLNGLAVSFATLMDLKGIVPRLPPQYSSDIAAGLLPTSGPTVISIFLGPMKVAKRYRPDALFERPRYNHMAKVLASEAQ